jgi:hypothetical protein
MFAENYYRPSEFVAFLSDYRLGSEFCRKTLEAMVSYPGQYTKPGNPFLVLERYSPCSLYDFVTAYCRSIAPAGTFELIGSKESYCEEYIPYFLTEGARVIQIIRDPRDIIASLNYGRGEVFGGRIRPHLLNLRQWRKSVAFALQYARDPDFLAVRYEDLVRDPGATMGIVHEFLTLDPVPDAVYEHDIRAQDGGVWDSNSSHFRTRRVDSRSVGRYRELLSRETDRFVQASCFCEMRVLGYELDIGPDDVPGIVNRYQEDVPLTRPELAAYAWSAQRREEELRRLGCLRNGSFEPFFLLF